MEKKILANLQRNPPPRLDKEDKSATNDAALLTAMTMRLAKLEQTVSSQIEELAKKVHSSHYIESILCIGLQVRKCVVW